MPIYALKIIRFFVPALFIYFSLAMICWASNWCSIAVPGDYQAFTKSFAAIALGAIYYALPLRECSNQSYFDRVNQNLLGQLTSPFRNDAGVPKTLTWRQARKVFYPIVDGDKSLEHLKLLAFWNGAFWTSAADLRVISGFSACIVGILMLAANLWNDGSFDNAKATYIFLAFVVLFIASIALSELTTRKHLRIGTQQAEYICQNHQQELREKLIQASAQ